MKLSRSVALCLFLLFIPTLSLCQEWWQTWEIYPKVPKISAKEAKQKLLTGEKMVFVYAGFEVEEVVCGSLMIPYTLVPPSGDGSSIKYRIPKDYWVLCYCP